MAVERLRVLFVEDSREDVEIEERELRKAGLLFDSVRVETGEALYLALEESAPNLIISDYTLPQMDGLRALKIAHALRPDVPFIFVSGTIGEERAVESLKRGATDYVLKHNLTGLVPAVERALRDARERDERRKKAAQKLPEAPPQDAFARLSGGLASDLDDLLTVIAGYTQLAMECAGDEKVARQLEQVLRAADRASRVSRRLLVLGGTRSFRMDVLDLNHVILGMEERIRRVLGGAIEMSGILDWRLGQLTADRGQVEQLVLHLAIQAREAMPDGGKVTFETSQAEADSAELAPGRYVLLSVRDTGCAPTESRESHPFEPFEGAGKSSGLGLSIAMGIVQAMGGTVRIDADPARGTTVRVYLPRSDSGGKPSGK